MEMLSAVWNDETLEKRSLLRVKKRRERRKKETVNERRKDRGEMDWKIVRQLFSPWRHCHVVCRVSSSERKIRTYLVKQIIPRWAMIRMEFFHFCSALSGCFTDWKYRKTAQSTDNRLLLLKSCFRTKRTRIFVSRWLSTSVEFLNEMQTAERRLPTFLLFSVRTKNY